MVRLSELVFSVCLICVGGSDMDCIDVCGVCCVIVLIIWGRNIILFMFDNEIENVCVVVVGLNVLVFRMFCCMCVIILCVVGMSVSVCGVGFMLCEVCMNNGLLNVVCSFFSVVFMLGWFMLSCCVVMFMLCVLCKVSRIGNRFRLKLGRVYMVMYYLNW